MPGSFRIARVGGIDIRLHFTFLLILPILAIAFAREFVSFRSAATMAGVPPESIRGAPFVWGLIIAVALFASVLVHELAHALFAIRKGGKVRDITLLMIGGVASLSEPPRDPRHEAAMAAVGPLTSFVLAGVFYGASLLLGGTDLHSLRFATFYLAAMNLFLAVFNLLPAFPMDGGRVVRGVLAARMGTVRATRIASTLGKAFALLFVLWSFVTFNFFLMLIAFFVYVGAQAEDEQVLAQTVLGEVRVKDLAQPPPSGVDASGTVEDAALRMLRSNQLALLVTSGGEPLGVVTLDDVEKVPPGDRRGVAAASIARSAPPVTPSTNVWDALRSMREQGLPLVPVVEAGRLVGVLHQGDVIRALRLHRLRPGPRPRPAPLVTREQPA